MSRQGSYRHRAATSGDRLDRYWARILSEEGVSRSSIKKRIQEGRARVNQVVCSDPRYKVREGDDLQLEPGALDAGLSPDPSGLQIRWQNEHLAVVNKPPGLSVHPAGGEAGPTLAHRLLYIFPWLASGKSQRPGIVHRLDKDTSGLMAVGLTPFGEREMARQLGQREVYKEYLALVHGCPEPESGSIEAPIGRDPARRHKMRARPREGRRAKSSYRVLRRFPAKGVSLLAVRIQTGRTHQIRVHLAYIGHPVLGDRLYGPQALAEFRRRQPARLSKLLSRQMLHSWRLGFIPPGQGEEVQLTQPPAKDFLRMLLQMEKRTQRVAVTGTVGCGKSALTGLVSGDSLPVWSADETVARLYEPGEPGWQMLRRSFGNRFVPDPEGPVDKARLFREMSDSQEIRREVQSLVHPLVRRDMEDFFLRHEDCRMALAEIPLLAESGWRERDVFDVVVGVHCPDRIRREHLARKRGLDRQTVENMEAWQLSQKEKLQQADLVVTNPGDWQGLQEAAARLRNVLASLRRNRLRRFLSWLDRLSSSPFPGS